MTGFTLGFSLRKIDSSISSRDLGCFCFKRLSVLSSRESTLLESRFIFPFSTVKANLLDNAPVLFGVFVIFERCCIILASNKSSSVLPSFYTSIIPSKPLK